MKRINFDISESSHRKLKEICAKKDISIKKFITDFIEQQIKLDTKK